MVQERHERTQRMCRHVHAAHAISFGYKSQFKDKSAQGHRFECDRVGAPATTYCRGFLRGTEAVPEQPVAGLAEQRVWRVSRESFVLSCLRTPMNNFE